MFKVNDTKPITMNFQQAQFITENQPKQTAITDGKRTGTSGYQKNSLN